VCQPLPKVGPEKKIDDQLFLPLFLLRDTTESPPRWRVRPGFCAMTLFLFPLSSGLLLLPGRPALPGARQERCTDRLFPPGRPGSLSLPWTGNIHRERQSCPLLRAQAPEQDSFSFQDRGGRFWKVRAPFSSPFSVKQ